MREIREAYDNIINTGKIKLNQEILNSDWVILMNYYNGRIEVTAFLKHDGIGNASWRGFRIKEGILDSIIDWVDDRTKGELTGRKKTLSNTCKLHYLLLS